MTQGQGAAGWLAPRSAGKRTRTPSPYTPTPYVLAYLLDEGQQRALDAARFYLKTVQVFRLVCSHVYDPVVCWLGRGRLLRPVVALSRSYYLSRALPTSRRHFLVGFPAGCLVGGETLRFNYFF